MTDVVIIGAGIVGASCAYYASRAGLHVTVLDQRTAGSGSTSRGEGNILVSDKAAGPELALALLSHKQWIELGAELGADGLELEAKGGLVVATSEQSLLDLQSFSSRQQAAGVEASPVPSDSLNDYEPHLAPNLPGAIFYPQDMQVQPMHAAAAMLAAAQSRGTRLIPSTRVTSLERDRYGAVQAVHTTARSYSTRVVVNAAGAWASEVSRMLGGPVPVLPRRGFVLVTEPLPRVVRHKVYSADYVGNVASDDEALQTSAVIEGTRGGTLLIGASRERVGFDDTLSVEIVRRLATQAVELFPFLADISLMRAYHGFRPFCPDHLPVIGPDRRVPGLFHACGHEGAGIGLAPATGLILTELLTGNDPSIDITPFDPSRFETVTP